MGHRCSESRLDHLHTCLHDSLSVLSLSPLPTLRLETSLKLRINDCNGGPNQLWTLSSGVTAVQVAGQNYCLDAGSNPSNGIPSKIWTVSRGAAFPTLPSSLYRPMTLGAHRVTGDAADTQCYSGITAQTWYYTTDNRIAVYNQGQCLDLTNGVVTDGNVLQTWACSTGNNNQVWTV